MRIFLLSFTLIFSLLCFNEKASAGPNSRSLFGFLKQSSKFTPKKQAFSTEKIHTQRLIRKFEKERNLFAKENESLLKDDLKLFDPLAHTQQLVFKSIKLAFGGFEQPPHHEDWEMRPVASPYIILTAKPKLTLRLEKNFSGLNVIATQGPWDYKLGTMNEDNITAGVQKLLSGLTHATDKTWIPAYVGILTNEKVFNVLALGIAMEIHSQYNIYKTQGHFKNRLPIPTIEDWERARVKSVLHHYDLYIQGLESKKEVF